MRVLEPVERDRCVIRKIIVDAIVHDPVGNAVEVDDLILLVIHFGRAVDDLALVGPRFEPALAVGSYPPPALEGRG